MVKDKEATPEHNGTIDMCMIGWNKFGITYRFKIM